MFADGALAVFVECSWKPNRRTIGQRTKAGIEMIKARIDKLDRDDKAAKHVCDGAMRLDVRTKLIPAKECVTAKESIALALEVKILWQPRDFVTVLFHPASEMRRFAGALFVPEIARDKLLSNSKPGVGRENHVGKFRLRRDQMNLALQFRQGRMQVLPLFLRQRGFRPPRAAHPGIDLVFNPVVIRWTKKQLAHKDRQLTASDRRPPYHHDWRCDRRLLAGKFPRP